MLANMPLLLHVVISYIFYPNSVNANRTQDNITYSPTVEPSVPPITTQPTISSTSEQDSIYIMISALILIFCLLCLIMGTPLDIRRIFRQDEENFNEPDIMLDQMGRGIFNNNAQTKSRNNNIPNFIENREHTDIDEIVHYGDEVDEENVKSFESSSSSALSTSLKERKKSPNSRSAGLVAPGQESPYRTPKYHSKLKSIKEMSRDDTLNEDTENDAEKEKVVSKNMNNQKNKLINS